jgi:hypothetical protein
VQAVIRQREDEIRELNSNEAPMKKNIAALEEMRLVIKHVQTFFEVGNSSVIVCVMATL